MRTIKLLITTLLLAAPSIVLADASDVPASATWYFHVDLERMKSSDASRAVYNWMEDEIFTELKEESGVDFGEELDQLTAYSMQGQGPVLLFEGDISQESKDKVMTFIAAEGDLQSLNSSGRSYYRVAGTDEGAGHRARLSGNSIEIDIESLEEESWVSLDLKNKIIVTSGEEQMKAMLKGGGKIAGSRSHGNALVVLTAEKTLLQAGMNSESFGDSDDSDSGWDSNILRNTRQVAFMVAAAKDKLAVEAKLITTEAEMAKSLASVVRGLISLVSFDDDMDVETKSALQGTKVVAKGNALSISLAIDPDLVVSTLSD